VGLGFRLYEGSHWISGKKGEEGNFKGNMVTARGISKDMGGGGWDRQNHT